MAHTLSGILLSHKKEPNHAICSNMGAARDSHTKRSKSERERNTTWYHLYVESNLYMTQMNLSTKQKQTHRQREQICDCQGGGEGSGMDWKFGVGRCKLLHLEWISSEVLLYITELSNLLG